MDRLPEGHEQQPLVILRRQHALEQALETQRQISYDLYRLHGRLHRDTHRAFGRLYLIGAFLIWAALDFWTPWPWLRAALAWHHGFAVAYPAVALWSAILFALTLVGCCTAIIAGRQDRTSNQEQP